MGGSTVQGRGARVGVATAALALLAAFGVPAPTGAAIDDGVCQTTVFVAAQLDDVVVPIDVPTAVAGDPIELGQAASPAAQAITPDGSTLIVVQEGTQTVARIDVASGAITGSAPVGRNPVAVAITPHGSTALVVNSGYLPEPPPPPDPPWPPVAGTISVIDLATMATDPDEIPAGYGAAGIAITPDGSTAFVALEEEDAVATIDVATRTKDPDDIPVGPVPVAVAFTPDGSTAFVANRQNDQPPAPDPSASGTVSVIDVATRTTDPVPIGGFEMPAGVAITPDGTTAFVSDVAGDVVSSFDVASRTKDPVDIAVGREPLDLAVSPDGRQVYVANSGTHTVTAIDVATRSADPGEAISVGTAPGGVVFTPCVVPPPGPTTTTTTTTAPRPAPPAVPVVIDPRVTG
jgi:YVTN family beta-propeller protein